MKTNLINKIVKKLFNLLVHNQSYSLKSKITARGTQNSRLLLGDRRVPLQKWFSSGPLWGGSSRAARFARGAAASRQRARQRLASAACVSTWLGENATLGSTGRGRSRFAKGNVRQARLCIFIAYGALMRDPWCERDDCDHV